MGEKAGYRIGDPCPECGLPFDRLTRELKYVDREQPPPVVGCSNGHEHVLALGAVGADE